MILLIVGAVVLYALTRWAYRLMNDALTAEWLRDLERRGWGEGEDGVCWHWPVKR